MPYKLKGNCVVKLNGTVVKCHKTRKEALRHLRALEVNVEDAAAKAGLKRAIAAPED